MTIKLMRHFGVILLLGVMTSANGANISLVPISNTTAVGPGDVVSFDVVMDFSTNDNGMGSDITIGGGFDIAWDPAMLQFAGLVSADLGDLGFSRDPELFPGLLESWGFLDLDGMTGPALVGSVEFQVLPALGNGTTFVSTAATNGVSGPFVSAVDFVTILNVDYNSAAVTGSITDSDGDGVIDAGDNCQLTSNTDQRDTDGDSIGNSCDPDVAGPHDCTVNFLDLNVYRANFFQAGDLDTDNTGDGFTNFLDLNIVRSFFFGPPGPSAFGCN